MEPEHEQFLCDHVKRFGFFFIVDRLKDQFPDLGHEKACTICKEFGSKHPNKNAESQIKDLSEKIAKSVEEIIKRESQPQGAPPTCNRDNPCDLQP